MVQIPFQQKPVRIFKNNKSPLLHYAGQISNDPTWSFPSHQHNDLTEIIYISEGEGSFIIDDRGYTARKGDILIYNRGVLHEEHSNPGNPLKTYFCGIGQLHFAGMEEGFIVPRGQSPVIPTGPYSRQVEGELSTIFEEIQSQVYGFETVCQNMLVNLLISVRRILDTRQDAGDLPASAEREDSLSLKIKTFLDSNYTKDIPLAEIANRLYISPYYLGHLFKQETGYSPNNYMIQRRIGEARQLLLTTDLTVQEIAERVGYDNSSYFSTLFKKATGQSPSSYRDTARGKLGG
ncbi:AraC family transcriptional regulator [Paenibacillus koleovorans]|uniref:AraC family transcriptional regulator n=1 Tax=Paenibacillus koleovorans TaxID=121608 RepID=UPI0013E3FC3D|nr:AraC family transcriptional regulator [Paenibacillus koleovorans]